MVKRGPIPPNQPSKFTAESLKNLAHDLKTGRLPLERMTASDDRVIGLRAIATRDGNVSFHVSYHYGDKRPFMWIGELSDDKKNPDRLSIDDARDIARTVHHLAGLGIDPQEGLHRRLIKELKTQGTKWRP